jgi:hypothetical protein
VSNDCGCHYGYVKGYETIGVDMARLLERDLFGVTDLTDVQAIDVTTAQMSGDTIVVATKSDATDLTADDGVAQDFQVLGSSRTIAGVSIQGTNLVITLSPGSGTPTGIVYTGHATGSAPSVHNAHGVGLLSFDLDVAR